MLCTQDLVEALSQQNFWIGATGYLSDALDRLVEPDGRCGVGAQDTPKAAESMTTCRSCKGACKARSMIAALRGCRKNFVPVSPFHYGEDGRLHVVFMGSGYYAAQVHICAACVHWCRCPACTAEGACVCSGRREPSCRALCNNSAVPDNSGMLFCLTCRRRILCLG